MNIFVTAIGSFAADIVIKTLRANHHKVIGCDVYPREWIADACNVDEFVQAPYASEDEKYINFIQRICRKFAIQYIMPLTDPEVDVLCTIKDKLLGMGICVCVPDYSAVILCRDKYLLPQYLHKTGICTTIPTDIVDGSDIDEEYPWLAKPRFGRSSQGVIRVKSRAEYEYVKAMDKDSDYIIQPCIKGSIITVDVIRNADDTVVCIARRELLRNSSGAGTTVEIIEDRHLTETCAQIARALRVIGAVNFEFIEAEDQIYFLEANPRFSGGVEFSHLAGYDVVSNHLRCFSGHLIDTEVKIKKMIIARKYEEYVTAEL